MQAPDRAIPSSVLAKAEGIAIFPSTLRGGFIVGGHHGRGVLSVRSQDKRAWASTDVQMRAEILSYSRARGLFAGISLNGSSIREDRDSNEAFYGQPLRTRQVVLDGEAKTPQPPDALQAWFAALKPHFPAIK